MNLWTTFISLVGVQVLLFWLLTKHLQRMERQLMKTLDEVLADVQAEGSVVDSVLTLLSGVEQQLKDALSGITLPAPAQAKVDAIFDAVEANKGKLQAAITANTPAPTPTPTPPADQAPPS